MDKFKPYTLQSLKLIYLPGEFETGISPQAAKPGAEMEWS
jgi:hypothetical protein